MVEDGLGPVDPGQLLPEHLADGDLQRHLLAPVLDEPHVVLQHADEPVPHRLGPVEPLQVLHRRDVAAVDPQDGLVLLDGQSQVVQLLLVDAGAAAENPHLLVGVLGQGDLALVHPVQLREPVELGIEPLQAGQGLDPPVVQPQHRPVGLDRRLVVPHLALQKGRDLQLPADAGFLGGRQVPGARQHARQIRPALLTPVQGGEPRQRFGVGPVELQQPPRAPMASSTSWRSAS